MSLVGSSGHQVTPIFRGVPGQSWDAPCGILQTPILRGVPGLSWDVPCGILRTPSHTNLQRCPRTVLGCPLWDPPDTKSHQSSEVSQDCPGMSLVGSSGHQVTPIFIPDAWACTLTMPARALAVRPHTANGLASTGVLEDKIRTSKNLQGNKMVAYLTVRPQALTFPSLHYIHNPL